MERKGSRFGKDKNDDFFGLTVQCNIGSHNIS